MLTVWFYSRNELNSLTELTIMFRREIFTQTEKLSWFFKQHSCIESQMFALEHLDLKKSQQFEHAIKLRFLVRNNTEK